jgi:D-alanyl-D-alanine carboxypeptidase
MRSLITPSNFFRVISAMAVSLLTLSPAISQTQTELKNLEDKLTTIVGGSVHVPGIIVSIKASGDKKLWSMARGGRIIGQPDARPDDEFRIASVTKSFVAASILRLVEDGKLKLNQPVAELVSVSTKRQLEDAGYQAGKITLSHLLTHGSGLHDHSTAPSFAEAVAANPMRLWTRSEQVALAVEKPPLGLPGKVRQYSDTGYVILGEIVEKATGKPLADAVKNLVDFGKLGLKHTYWEMAQNDSLAAVPNNRIHAYQDGIDTALVNPSFDLFGGGGIVSTAQDLAIFYEALLSGRIFKAKSTLKLLTSGTARSGTAFAQSYAHGVYRIADTGSAVCWGHPGHWGILAGSCLVKMRRVSFAVAVNGAGTQADSVLQKAVDAVIGAIKH